MDKFHGLIDLFGMNVDWWRIINMEDVDLLAALDTEDDPVLSLRHGD